ncbi:hypothetical protein NC651_022467 [Populus alba x Populus x berolinensis]|nr:hypothetical protein NC651_022467 [Populus alba x Populus x berolinensis]
MIILQMLTQQEEKLTGKSLVPEMDEILSSATSWMNSRI